MSSSSYSSGCGFGVTILNVITVINIAIIKTKCDTTVIPNKYQDEKYNENAIHHIQARSCNTR
jgi:hypothetical protein